MFTCRVALFHWGQVEINLSEDGNGRVVTRSSRNSGHYTAHVCTRASDGRLQWKEANDGHVRDLNYEQRYLSEDSHGRLKPVILLYAEETVPYTTKVVGLPNVEGNQCFFNASMQLMYPICHFMKNNGR